MQDGHVEAVVRLAVHVVGRRLRGVRVAQGEAVGRAKRRPVQTEGPALRQSGLEIGGDGRFRLIGVVGEGLQREEAGEGLGQPLDHVLVQAVQEPVRGEDGQPGVFHVAEIHQGMVPGAVAVAGFVACIAVAQGGLVAVVAVGNEQRRVRQPASGRRDDGRVGGWPEAGGVAGRVGHRGGGG